MKLKEKLLNFGQSIGLNKSDLAHELGISKSNFVGESMKSELNGGLLVKFCKIHPEISTDWLLRDEGPMLRNGDQTVNVFDGSGNNAVINGINNGTVEQHDTSQCPPCEQCPLLEAKNQVIEAQQGTIEAQRIAIDSLRR